MKFLKIDNAKKFLNQVMIKSILGLMLLGFVGTLNAQDNPPLYSFFTAGHTYGNPYDSEAGLHPPFVDYIPEINSYPGMELGFLTGDVVYYFSAPYWDATEADIEKITMPVHIAPGNHDIGTEYIARYGEYYYSFVHNDDLFVILTPGLNAWNIIGDQLDFLSRTLESTSSSVNNIFIFLHQLIWWSPDNMYKNIVINYSPQYPGSTNFENTVKPILKSYPNKITVFAGDLGAKPDVTPFMYHRFDNITLIGSGMGGGQQDNFIITNVYEDSVHYDLVAINGDNPNALGELSDFSLTSVQEENYHNSINVYPNPAREYITVNNDSPSNLDIRIFDLSGRIVQSESVQNHTAAKLNITRLNSGTYFLHILSDKESTTRKIIVQK